MELGEDAGVVVGGEVALSMGILGVDTGGVMMGACEGDLDTIWRVGDLEKVKQRRIQRDTYEVGGEGAPVVGLSGFPHEIPQYPHFLRSFSTLAEYSFTVGHQ